MESREVSASSESALRGDSKILEGLCNEIVMERERKELWRNELKKRYHELDKAFMSDCKPDDREQFRIVEELDTIDHVMFCTGDFYDAVAAYMKGNGIHEVVDIGCANGHQAEVFLQEGFSYIGVERCTYLEMWKPDQVTYLFGEYPISIGDRKRLGCSNLCYGYFFHDCKALAEQFEEVILDNLLYRDEIETYFTIHELNEDAYLPTERERTIFLLKNKNVLSSC